MVKEKQSIEEAKEEEDETVPELGSIWAEKKVDQFAYEEYENDEFQRTRDRLQSSSRENVKRALAERRGPLWKRFLAFFDFDARFEKQSKVISSISFLSSSLYLLLLISS